MGYALFASRKQVLEAQVQCVQLQHTQRSDEQFFLATQQLGLKQQMNSLTAAQASELAEYYGQLSEATTSDKRDSINATIREKEQEFKNQLDDINREIYEISMKEQAIQQEVKRLDTTLTALQHQQQALEQAEGKAIEQATPKFGGLG